MRGRYVLEVPLGINIHTAVKHAARSNSRWCDYPELRASPQEGITRASVTSGNPRKSKRMRACTEKRRFRAHRERADKASGNARTCH